jgi:hypothetical protein
VLSITADVAFTATLPADSPTSHVGRLLRGGGHGGGRIDGRLRARDQVITVQLSALPSLAPLVAPAPAAVVRAAAAHLAHHGLTVLITGSADQVIIEMGHLVRAPRWQTLLARSPSIRIRSVRACLRSLRGPRLL